MGTLEVAGATTLGDQLLLAYVIFEYEHHQPGRATREYLYHTPISNLELDS